MRFFLIPLLTFYFFSAGAQQLNYYLPGNVSYDPAVPKPSDIILHDVGEWHVTHDRLVNYMTALARAVPDRIRMTIIGMTYENRPQVVLTISSPNNIRNLEQIREQHVALTDPSRSGSLDIEKMPVVIYIGHSIHGNESSGANASLLTAYHLAAAKGKEIEELLDEVVILLDPSFNPDGLQRFSTWVNQHKSKNVVSDPNSREFNEVWPGGRFNHYWFDLNRDWLPAVHPESQNRLQFFHSWKPNILTDHHEQGSNSAFFFQPGVPSRVNPLSPQKGQELTGKLGKYHAKFLDRIGSLYFTKENFDDFYYGKGSTYPDISGGIGILFEQASSRGHVQQTSNGLLRFPFTIKNQFTTALSTLEGGKALRKEFLQFQRDFFKSRVQSKVSGYIFGDKNDRAKTFHFIDMLQRHQIAVTEVKNGNEEFSKESSYVVSLDQPQQLVIRAIFEKQLDFKDSLFYDITSWTMPLAFNIPYHETDPGKTAGQLLGRVTFPKGTLLGQSDYAYVFEWNELYAPRALYELLDAGVIAKVATNFFELPVNGTNHFFNYGSIIVPVQLQQKNIHEIVKQVAERNAITIYPAQGGSVLSGSDLGSNKVVSVTKPSIALLVGTGVNATDIGEVWHLLDQRMNIPVSHLESSVFNRVDLSKYTTIIMAGGSYPDINREKMRTWVQGGGTLILIEEAVTWGSQNGINAVTFKKPVSPSDSSSRLPYIQKEQIDGAQQMHGAIIRGSADLTHPLLYGYHSKHLPVFKSNKVFMEKSKNPYATPLYYSESPLMSGFTSRENMAGIKNSAAIVVNTSGNGRVINMAENPVFRGFWFSGFKLLLNAIFFGRIIDPASARTE